MTTMIRLTKVWYDHQSHTYQDAPLALAPSDDIQITKDKDGYTSISVGARKPVTVREVYHEVLARLDDVLSGVRMVHVELPDVKPYHARFHRWDIMDEDGQRFPVAIVERDDGTIAVVYAEHVRFVDREVPPEEPPEDGTPATEHVEEDGTVA